MDKEGEGTRGQLTNGSMRSGSNSISDNRDGSKWHSTLDIKYIRTLPLSFRYIQCSYLSMLNERLIA